MLSAAAYFPPARLLHAGGRSGLHSEGKIVSVFAPQTEVIRKGKAGKPNEFGNLVKIQEAENQIVTHYEVFEERPSDSALLIPSIERHIEQFGRAPETAAADAGFFSAANEATAEELDVRRVACPANPPRAPSANNARKSGGSRKPRNGAPAAKVASAFSNAATGSGAVATRVPRECGALSGSACVDGITLMPSVLVGNTRGSKVESGGHSPSF